MHRRRVARAAFLAVVAAVACVVVPAGQAAAAVPFSSFNAGVLAGEQVVNKVWNNANSDAYAVGMVAKNPDTGGACMVQLNRTRFVRHADGERELHLQIANLSYYPCQVTVYLGRPAATSSTVVTGVPRGQSATDVVNNPNSGNYVYLIGAVAGTPTSGDCVFEVYTAYQRSQSVNQLQYTAKNVGTQTCSVKLNVVKLPVWWSTDWFWFEPGDDGSLQRSFPTETNVVVAGAVPGVPASGTCKYQIGPTRIFFGDDVRLSYPNTGSVYCAFDVTVALLETPTS